MQRNKSDRVGVIKNSTSDKGLEQIVIKGFLWIPFKSTLQMPRVSENTVRMDWWSLKGIDRRTMARSFSSEDITVAIDGERFYDFDIGFLKKKDENFCFKKTKVAMIYRIRYEKMIW